MKLSKLYCNQAFKNIIFNTEQGGLNAILAEVKDKHLGKNQHNLGKTKLVELIDFLLLKEIKRKDGYWLTKLSIFNNYEFYLEILLNDGKYLTIKRCVSNNTKISFKLEETSSSEFIFHVDWDYLDIPFDKAKEKLNEFIGVDFCEKNTHDYRKIIGYSLRGQNDYDRQRQSIFQLAKFFNDKDWKPTLFSLLGFDGNLLKSKYDAEEFIKNQKKIIKQQEKDFDLNNEERDDIVGKLQIKQQEKDELEKNLDVFNFYQEDKNIINELVVNIENNISELNSELYQVKYDIQKLEQSIKNKFSFDLNKVKEVFHEVELYFPESLLKNYEQLVDFNKKITVERNQQIRTTLAEKHDEKQKIQDTLVELNNKKEKYAELIKDNTLFKKYKTYQKELIKIEAELIHFKYQLDAFDMIDNKKREVENKRNNELQNIVNNLKLSLAKAIDNKIYMSIRGLFAEFVKEILQETGYISVNPNKNNNINFECKFSATAQDEGNSYYKLLCVAFDLAILTHYAKESYLKFVYHDDVFSQLDNRIKSNLIKVIQKVCLQYDIQYIFSAIEDDIPNTPEFDFEKHEVILRLHDNDDTGKLFLRSF